MFIACNNFVKQSFLYVTSELFILICLLCIYTVMGTWLFYLTIEANIWFSSTLYSASRKNLPFKNDMALIFHHEKESLDLCLTFNKNIKYVRNHLNECVERISLYSEFFSLFMTAVETHHNLLSMVLKNINHEPNSIRMSWNIKTNFNVTDLASKLLKMKNIAA